MLAIVIPFDKPGPAAVRITRNWYAPVGGVLMAGCGLYALTGFPLDDIWHRIFGQDVTLWGPTHLMMIGGANFSLFAALLLEYEGRRALPGDAPPDRPFVKGHALPVTRRIVHRDVGLSDRIRLRCTAVPAGVPADADRRRGSDRDHRRPRDDGPGRSDHRGTVRGGAARSRGADSRTDSGCSDQLVPAVSGSSGGGRVAGPHSTVPAPDPVRRGRWSGRRHRRPVAGVAVDRRGVPLSVADAPVGRSAGDGNAGGGAGRSMRGDVRDGA